MAVEDGSSISPGQLHTDVSESPQVPLMMCTEDGSPSLENNSLYPSPPNSSRYRRENLGGDRNGFVDTRLSEDYAVKGGTSLASIP